MTRTMIIPALLAVMLAPSCAISADANAANELQKKVANFKTQDGVEIVGDYFPPTGRAISPVAVLLPLCLVRARTRTLIRCRWRWSLGLGIH